MCWGAVTLRISIGRKLIRPRDQTISRGADKLWSPPSSSMVNVRTTLECYYETLSSGCACDSRTITSTDTLSPVNHELMHAPGLCRWTRTMARALLTAWFPSGDMAPTLEPAGTPAHAGRCRARTSGRHLGYSGEPATLRLDANASSRAVDFACSTVEQGCCEVRQIG